MPNFKANDGAFKMKGPSMYASPIKQKQVPLSKHEKINDLESELYNLREDLKGGSVKQPPLMKSGKRITSIQAQLKKLRA